MQKSMKVKRTEPEKAPQTEKERKQETKKALSKVGKIVLVAIGCAAMLLSVTAMACSGVLNQVTGNGDSYTLTGGVAATVNGVNITEDTVTKQIMGVRGTQYEDDAAWAKYLVGQGLTPETYRENVINSHAREYLLGQAVREYGITVSADELEDAWKRSAEQYGGEEQLLDFVTMMGYDKEAYKKQALAGSLELDKLEEEVAPTKDPSDEEILAYFNENLDTYNDGRRSQNLLISVASDASDEEKAEAKQEAEDILAQINAGELSFEDAVEEHSDDRGSKEQGGDVGWDKLTRFVTEYQDALSALAKDEVSGVVETSYGYHIIKCTDVFKADGTAASIDELPEEYQTYLSNVVKTQAQQAAYNEWLDGYVEKAEIVINPMPENVPYNVDMALADEADADAEAGSEE